MLESLKDYQDAAKQKQEIEDQLNQDGLTEEQKAQLQTQLAQAQQAVSEAGVNYEHWKEGGVYRVALHTLAGGLSSGVAGALGAGTTAALAPQITQWQNEIQASFTESGLSKEQASLVGQALMQGIIAGIGNSLGGTSTSYAALTTDTNNRQLHPTEIYFLQDEERVARYIAYLEKLKGRALTEEEKEQSGKYLQRYGAAMVDAHWAALNGRDTITETFILGEAAQYGGTYTASDGSVHALFQATEAEYMNETINLKQLFSGNGDNSAILAFLNANYEKSRQENYLQRFAAAQKQGEQDASDDANPITDAWDILSGILPGIVDTVSSDEVGPLDSAQMREYYQKLLLLQGRAEDAGYIYEYDYATAQRYMIIGLALGEAGGTVLGEAISKLKKSGASAAEIETALADMDQVRRDMEAANQKIIEATDVSNGTISNVPKGLAGVPGRVQSRINVSNEGWEHVLKRHFSGNSNASQFSVSQSELKSLLQSKQVVGSPVTRTVESADGLRYVREIDMGRSIGVDAMNGNTATSVMTTMSDKYGNLITAFPGVLK